MLNILCNLHPCRADRRTSSPVMRPSAAVPAKRVKGGSLPSSAYRREDADQPPVEGESQLFAIMLAATPHHPSSAGEQSALRSFVLEVAKRSEPVTLKNAIRTWQELGAFASSVKMDVSELSALLLATFVQLNGSAARAFNSLNWPVNNLKLSFDGSLEANKEGGSLQAWNWRKASPSFPSNCHLRIGKRFRSYGWSHEADGAVRCATYVVRSCALCARATVREKMAITRVLGVK